MNVVRVSWMNPARRLDQHPEALEGIKLEQRIDRPADQYFLVANKEEADKLKAQIETRVPRNSYTVIDENKRPVVQSGHPYVVTEPNVEIIDMP
jgi:hypothetical protein